MGIFTKRQSDPNWLDDVRPSYEAIRLAEQSEARVTVVSVGPEDAVQGLRKGLAMGADDAVFVEAADFLADGES